VRSYTFAYILLKCLAYIGLLIVGISALLLLFTVLRQLEPPRDERLIVSGTFIYLLCGGGMVVGTILGAIAELGLALVDTAVTNGEIVQLLKERLPALPQAIPMQTILQKPSKTV
jgi:hypothetical protein